MLGGATKNSQSFLNEQKVGVAFVESERFTETKFEKRQLNEFVITSWNRFSKVYVRNVIPEMLQQSRQQQLHFAQMRLSGSLYVD